MTFPSLLVSPFSCRIYLLVRYLSVINTLTCDIYLLMSSSTCAVNLLVSLFTCDINLLVSLFTCEIYLFLSPSVTFICW